VTEQEKAYTEVFAAFPHHKVVLRTLDAGADKPLAFLDQGEEPNPALGVRGLRVAFERPDIWTGSSAPSPRPAERTSAEVWSWRHDRLASEASWFADRVRSHGLRTAG